MSEVNVLWSSAWCKLQKNLASSFAADGSDLDQSRFESSGQGRASPTSSWLVRARRRKAQVSRIVQ